MISEKRHSRSHSATVVTLASQAGFLGTLSLQSALEWEKKNPNALYPNAEGVRRIERQRREEFQYS